MKKTKKIFWGVVVALVVLIVVGVIIASAFLGPIVKAGIETIGPRITKVSVKVNQVHLSLLTGSASIEGLVVGNPKGYHTPQAISAKMIAVAVNPPSVLSHKIVLRSVQIESPQITFEGGLTGNNLSQILDNVEAATQSAAPSSATVSTNAAAPAQPSKKFEVDNLLITGAKVHVSLTDLGGKEMTLPLPPIHLNGLGKNKDGITAADLTRSVLDAIVTATVKAVSNAGVGVGKNAKNLGKQGVNTIKKGIGNLLGK